MKDIKIRCVACGKKITYRANGFQNEQRLKKMLADDKKLNMGSFCTRCWTSQPKFVIHAGIFDG